MRHAKTDVMLKTSQLKEGKCVKIIMVHASKNCYNTDSLDMLINEGDMNTE